MNFQHRYEVASKETPEYLMLVDDDNISTVNIPDGVLRSTSFVEFIPQLKNVDTQLSVSKLLSI